MLIAALLLACQTDPDAGSATPQDTSTTPSPEPTADAVVCDGDDGGLASILVQPFLQQVEPDSAWIVWEATGPGSRVDHGEALDQVVCGTAEPTIPTASPDASTAFVHRVQLTGLPPDTAIPYRVRTGAAQSAVHTFRTAPTPEAEAPFHLVAMSDSQSDSSHPEVFHDLLHDGVMPLLAAEGDAAMVLFPGDLVDNGWSIDQWRDELFAPGADLWATTPIVPAIGNHEGGSPLYFAYFHLPEESGLAEHAYHQDHGNLRVLALDSNGYQETEQLAWLDAQLGSTCDDPSIDFVFAQLHHPMLSELWVPGESDFTAEVVARLEAFSTACGKPSVHFFGHTHAYSRGQSRDHQHLMVNVASAGGGLDRWGQQLQADYAPFTVSQDHYGFVTVHVEAGDAPSFRLTRYDRGTPEAPLPNVVSDTITILRDNAVPATPTPQPLVCPATLAIGAFRDPEGHAHQATQWQVDPACTFVDPIVDRWRQDRNEYQGVDTQAGDDLSDEDVPELLGLGPVCWRARVRDEHLAWSAWTSPQTVDAADCPE